MVVVVSRRDTMTVEASHFTEAPAKSRHSVQCSSRLSINSTSFLKEMRQRPGSSEQNASSLKVSRLRSFCARCAFGCRHVPLYSVLS